MTFNPTRFASALNRCGLSKRELGILYGVTRVTLYAWLNGGRPKHVALDRWATTVTEALIRAIDRNLLPFPESFSHATRTQRVEKMRSALLETKTTAR